MTGLVVSAILLVLLALYLRGLAGRLDRLHVRVEAARDALDAALVRRTAAALELAHSALLDPATSVLLAEEAYHAQVADDQDRQAAESELTTALVAALPDDETIAEVADNGRGDALLGALRVACGRVVLARRFYNDTVRLTRSLRDRRLVRGLRLAGTAAYPEPFLMEDQPPPALGAVGGAGQVA